MGLLTDFYVAPRALANGILDGTKVKGLLSVELKGIDPVKLATLETIAAKLAAQKGAAGDTQMLTDEEAEQWVLLVSPRLVGLLAKASDLDALAAAWAKTPGLKSDRWTAKTARGAIEELAKLAAVATKTKKDVLLKMSM